MATGSNPFAAQMSRLAGAGVTSRVGDREVPGHLRALLGPRSAPTEAPKAEGKRPSSHSINSGTPLATIISASNDGDVPDVTTCTFDELNTAVANRAPQIARDAMLSKYSEAMKMAMELEIFKEDVQTVVDERNANSRIIEASPPPKPETRATSEPAVMPTSAAAPQPQPIHPSSSVDSRSRGKPAPSTGSIPTKPARSAPSHPTKQNNPLGPSSNVDGMSEVQRLIEAKRQGKSGLDSSRPKVKSLKPQRQIKMIGATEEDDGWPARTPSNGSQQPEVQIEDSQRAQDREDVEVAPWEALAAKPLSAGVQSFKQPESPPSPASRTPSRSPTKKRPSQKKLPRSVSSAHGDLSVSITPAPSSVAISPRAGSPTGTPIRILNMSKAEQLRILKEYRERKNAEIAELKKQNASMEEKLDILTKRLYEAGKNERKWERVNEKLRFENRTEQLEEERDELIAKQSQLHGAAMHVRDLLNEVKAEQGRIRGRVEQRLNAFEKSICPREMLDDIEHHIHTVIDSRSKHLDEQQKEIEAEKERWMLKRSYEQRIRQQETSFLQEVLDEKNSLFKEKALLLQYITELKTENQQLLERLKDSAEERTQLLEERERKASRPIQDRFGSIIAEFCSGLQEACAVLDSARTTPQVREYMAEEWTSRVHTIVSLLSRMRQCIAPQVVVHSGRGDLVDRSVQPSRAQSVQQSRAQSPGSSAAHQHRGGTSEP